VKSDKVLIRTGGGYCNVNDHVKKYALSECLIIWRTMQQKHITFNEAVVNLLQMHNADEQLIQDYQEETTDEISDLFELLCSLMKQKEFGKYLTREQKSKLNSEAGLNWSKHLPSSHLVH